MLFNILKIKPIFGDFVIRYRFSMLFDAGLSIVRNRFWVHIRCRFDILKYCAALLVRLWQAYSMIVLIDSTFEGSRCSLQEISGINLNMQSSLNVYCKNSVDENDSITP